jgi:quinolinate synthase
MTKIEEQVNRYGYVTEAIADDIDLIAEINRLKKRKTL